MGPSMVHWPDLFVIIPYIAIEQISTYATRLWQPVTPKLRGELLASGMKDSWSVEQLRSNAARWTTASGALGGATGPHPALNAAIVIAPRIARIVMKCLRGSRPDSRTVRGVVTASRTSHAPPPTAPCSPDSPSPT